MRFKKGLLKERWNDLRGKKWYHQRFDGCLLLLESIAQSEIRNESKKRDCGKGIRVCFFKNGRADWYIDMEDIRRISLNIMKLAEVNPNISKDLIKGWEDADERFYSKCLEIGKLDLKKLSDKELIELFIEFKEIGFDRFSSSSIIDGFALGTDIIIADKIKEILEEKEMDDKFPEIFSVLSAPVHQSFINVAEIDLLKIALLVKSGKGEKEMKDYVKKYFWSRNNYFDAFVLEEDFFLKEIKETIDSGRDINEEIEKIKGTPERNKVAKEKLIKKLELDPYLVTLLTISEDFTFWQDERKRATYWNANYMFMLAEEIGKRFGFSLDEMKFISMDEISNFLEKVVGKSEVKERVKECVTYWDDDGVEVITNIEKIRDLKELILGNQDHSGIKEINGLCASVGKVVGRVKICKSATEVGKVKKGDILVAIMTRPDYVVGMKKAAAIVTEEGGVTSHAAIVSRELGIPCVIGTKIATKVLKDGDLVEVDADRGIVRLK